jgi:hypothetical protein
LKIKKTKTKPGSIPSKNVRNQKEWSPLTQPFVFFGEKSPKGDTAQIFWQKSPFILNSIRQIASLFKERVATSRATGYSFDAPGEKYRQLGEL